MATTVRSGPKSARAVAQKQGISTLANNTACFRIGGSSVMQFHNPTQSLPSLPSPTPRAAEARVAV
jgi:hypothetical protein